MVVDTLASDELQLDLQYIVELLHVGKGESKVSTAKHDSTGTPSPLFSVADNDRSG